MEEETNGTTFSKIFKTIWHCKWVTLAVAVIVTLFSAIILFYGFNPASESYVMEFSLNLPGDNNSSNYIYPDGKQFYYSDMTSLKTLSDIKKSGDAAFADIEVEKMAKNGHINIKRDISAMVDNNEQTTQYREITYTISVKASYFANGNVAKDFLVRLAASPADYLAAMEIDYGIYLPMAKATKDYEEEIVFLKAQLNDIEKKYSTLITTYGDSFVVKEDNNGKAVEDAGNKTLLAYSQEVKAYKDSKALDNLLTKAQKNYYIKAESNKAAYELELIELTKERDKAQKTLETLLDINKSENGGTSGITVVLDAAVIKAQQDLVTDLNNKISVVENYISKGNLNADFDKEIDKAYQIVSGYTERYSKASANVYANTSSVVYIQPGIIAEEGGLSLIKIVLISLIAGIVIALVAGYVAGYLSLRKEKAKAANSAEEVSVQEELVVKDAETEDAESKKE